MAATINHTGDVSIRTASGMRPAFTLSIVSHGQSGLIGQLLEDLVHYCQGLSMEIILTINVPEQLPYQVEESPFQVTVIENPLPKGFAENHNAAFGVARGEVFCVINPDIRLRSNPFEELSQLTQDASVGVVGPMVVNSAGALESSARRFPSPWRILKKLLRIASDTDDYEIKGMEIYPDWVGGMFMLFRSDRYKEVGGFNERYFLYYEDVDICARLALCGYKTILSPKVTVVHDAQRTSHRKFKYLKWHATSMVRFFLSRTYWSIMWRKLAGHN